MSELLLSNDRNTIMTTFVQVITSSACLKISLRLSRRTKATDRLFTFSGVMFARFERLEGVGLPSYKYL